MAKLTLKDLKAMKAAGEPITGATACEYSGIRLAEEAGIELLFASDWVIATTLLGHSGAESLTLEQLLFYLHAQARVAQRAFILAAIPFGGWRASNEAAIANATALIKAGADAVVLPGGGALGVGRVRALAEVGVPCAAHLGWVPQQAKELGAERICGATAEEASELLSQSRALAQAGAWGLLLQNVPAAIARVMTERGGLITLGLGGTGGCDGQIALAHDLLGWPQTVRPLFSIPYADVFNRAVAALNRHCAEVRALEFPTVEHSFTINDTEFERFMAGLGDE